ncbi:DNA-binding transcriptional regulator, XRE-family HTH domain [Sphingopyxis sp. YR583]|uniref:helix-turn-helix transcriptional regulator n=1 Tax=Sphingopyxis sp. YR583 TaxID=1881047 RepID=UPI0008A78B7A|nr:helix-turn-helix transcriptional regulator [Sphingopyxis sp. YR583]SEH13739.1 DNA-binding transcriptional regulator, XRE-family HTH domain [Sphingopyxis sp. YR583]
MYDRALKTMRQYHRLSQSDLADQLKISRSYLNEIERGKKDPSLEVLSKYASRFDIPVSSIMLFAERTQNGTYDKARVFLADKVLKMLEWLAEDTEDEHESTSNRSAHSH